MSHTTPHTTGRIIHPAVAVVLVVALLSTVPGCVGVLAQLVNVGWGNTIPARYKGLEGKQVAVVCISGSSSFGPSSAADDIARSVSNRLRTNVSKIKLVSDEAIADWMDRNDWNQVDYRELGEGVNAEMVVAVDLSTFTLHEGKTLFRGRSELSVTVYDIINGGNVVYESSMPEIVYPATTGVHSGEMSEDAFRRYFVEIVAHRVGRHFYAYDATSDFGQDALVLGN
jgi:hypothetical protein